MPENPTSENERQFNPELHKEALSNLDQNFNLDNVSKNLSNIQETIDPYNPGIRQQKEIDTDVEFDQGALYDAASGFWNSFVVGTVEGAFNLLPTISNAIHETEFANDWIENVNKVSENFEYIYSDDYYKPIKEFGDITSSHFWAGLGNGIGFVAGIAKFAKAGQMLSKGSRAIARGEKLIEGTSDAYKAGAKARYAIDDAVKNIFNKSKTGKVVKKTPKFNEGIVGKVDDAVEKSMRLNLNKIKKLSEKSIKNSARMGSFIGGTTMMYNMVQDEAREAGLDPTSAARFSLGVASLVSLTEGAALEWIGKIPARSIQKQIVKAASKKTFKGAARKSPKQLMDSFLPNYTKALRGIDLFEGAAIEFGQEFSQTYIEEGAKQMYDEIFADEKATEGKGKFGKEVFDLESDSFGGFFTDGKDSKSTFTNSVFAGILGGIIGGGMAGMKLRAYPGERNIGNESLFNLVADDVIRDKTKNRDDIKLALDKALKKKQITQSDYKVTGEIIDEMAEFVDQQKVVSAINDPVAQYQLFNLNRAFKNIQSKIVTDEEVREKSGDIIDAQVEESVKLNQEKNSLFKTLIDAIRVNYSEILELRKPETLNANEFSDKVLAYQAIAEKIVGGAITTQEDLNQEIDKVYKTDFKEKVSKAKKEGRLAGEITEEEYQEFKEGNVSQERVNYLASKIIDEQDFTEREQEMADALKTEVEEAKEKMLKEKEKEKKEEKPKEKKTEKTETFDAFKYREGLKSLTAEELAQEKENLENKENKDSNKKEKLSAIEMQEFSNELKNPTKEKKEEGKKEEKKESKPTEETKEPTTYRTNTSLKQAINDKSITEDDIRETYNQALSDIKNKKNRRSASVIKNEIEKRAEKDERFSNAIKPKKDEKTEGSKETDKDSKEETKPEAKQEEKIEEVEVEEIKPTTKETTDIVKIEKETSVEVLREYDNAEINAIAKNSNNEAVEGLGQLISKDVKEVEGGKAEQEVYQYGVIQRITSEDGSKIQRVTDHYGKVYGIPIINLTMDAKEAGFFFDGKKEFSLTQKQITDFFNSKFGKPKTEEDVVEETKEDVGDSNLTGDNTVSGDETPSTINQQDKLDEKKNQKNQKEAEDRKDQIKSFRRKKGKEKKQRKGILSKAAESQKIADNLQLYQKIKEHFKKMFPMIPVSTVDILFDKYGVEILGKVSQEGITISNEAFQSTLAHEFAHVYIDLIADKKIVSLALDWIKGTKFFTNAQKAYSNDTVQTQAMEALVQAMSENAIPKLEEKLSKNQITKWLSIAKKLWRTIKRMFTGYSPSNYIDYLSDSLVFNSKPIMVETSYLEGIEKYERKALDTTDANFNNEFLLNYIKKFTINALFFRDTSFQAQNILGDIKEIFSEELAEGDAQTNKLNYKYNLLKEENNKFDGVNFNDLSYLDQTEILLNETIYEDGITYKQHINNVVEYLVHLPTEQIDEIEINKSIKENEKSESEKGKIEKEAIKGSKKMITSVNALLARLINSQGQMIHNDEAYAYLTNAAMKSSTTEELMSRIAEDSKKGNNEVPLALYNTLLALQEYDEQFGTDSLQTVLHQSLSNQSIPQKAILIKKDKEGLKEIQIRDVSQSNKRKSRTLNLKLRLTSAPFLASPIVGTEEDQGKKKSIAELLKQLINRKERSMYGFGFTDKLLRFELNEVNRLGNVLFDVNGEFHVEEYTNWLINDEQNLNKKNDKGKLTKRAKALQDIANEIDVKKRQNLSIKFFMSDILNTAAEQLTKDKNPENKRYKGKFAEDKGRVNTLMNFASQMYDGSIQNANMFINSSGNTVSTIRFGSALNRIFADISNRGRFAKEKNNSKVKTKDGDVYLFRDNPVFNSIYQTGIFKWAIDDAVNYFGDSVKEHSALSGIDLFISQFMFFSNDQDRSRYYQKVMINDRSHSNYIQVDRLDNDAIKNRLNEQRRVDQYHLNQGYKKLKNEEQKKKYLEEWNKLSYNFAYDVDGEVVVKSFDPIYLKAETDEKLDSQLEKNNLSEIEKKGIKKKVSAIKKETSILKKVLTKVGLLDTVQKDHVGKDGKYKTIDEMILSYVLNERVNRLAINDILSEPVATRLIKKGKVDKSNILKRNSGFDSTGLRVDLSDKKTMTVVYEMNDKDGNPISDSFLWRSKGMTEAIQKQLGDKQLDPISYNSKDGEYMINNKGENIYHKNSSVNYFGDEENNNIVEMAKAMMGDNYEESNFYRIAKMLEMLEEKYGDTHYIQIIDKDAIKGSKADIKAMKVEELYNAVSENDFDKIKNSKYEYVSQNFYIPFNENKEAKELNRQFAKLSTQGVKIWTNNSDQENALNESKQLEEKIIEYIWEQMGLEEGEDNYLNSREFDKLFNTEEILNELLKKVDDLQDPDTSELLKDIIKYNKKEGKILDRARRNKKRLEAIENRTPEQQEDLDEAQSVLDNKKTINKIDHPAMTPQLKQVILSRLQSKGLDVRVPGAYLKMVPDMDNRLKENEIILPYSMFGQGEEAKKQAEKFLKEQNEKGGLFVPGVRVPASDAISTINARVVGFIEGDANIAILPHSFTIKSDADHDGDKVFIYKPDVRVKDGKTVINENSKANEIYKIINRLSQSQDYKQRIEDGTINLDEFEKFVEEIDEELKQGETEGEADVKEGVDEIFKQTPELAEIGTERQYSAYLNSVFPNNKIFYKGAKKGLSKFNYSESLQKERGNKFGSGIYLTSNEEYANQFAQKNDGKKYTVLVDNSNVVSFKNKVAFLQAISKTTVPTAEQIDEYVKNLQKENKILYIEKSGVTDELVIGNENQYQILGSKEDVQAFKDFVSKKTSKKTEGLPSKFDFASSSEMSATDARMSFGETAVGILAVAGKLNSALYQANTRFREETEITIDGVTYNLNGVGVNEYDKTSNDLAMLLQGALDMASNPILLRSGIDGRNINVVVAMLIGGIPLKTVIKFINKKEVKSYYTQDQFENNAYTEKANKNKFEKTLSKEIEKQKEDSEERNNLETLQYFSQLSQELNAVTSIVQLDGDLPNDGYLLRDLKKVFNTIKSEESKTKLNYNNYSQKPFVRHYEKLVDAAIGLMSHHFITENQNYYKEIEAIQNSRNYSDVREYDPSVEKRRVDDLFSLMISQNLLDESQIADILENGVTTIIEDLKDTVLESIEYSYKQITGDATVTDYVNEKIETIKGKAKTTARNNYSLLFKYLKEDINIDGAKTNLGAYIENVLTENENDIEKVNQFLQKNTELEIGKGPKKNLKKLVDTVKDYKDFKEIKSIESLETNEKANNKFIKLLQLRNVVDPITDVSESVLSGKQDIRFLTSTQKQIAKRDFEKLSYQEQNRFLAYQLFKYGLSNKLGSIISIMPNSYTLEYLKEISNIKSRGEKEKKVYDLKQFRLAQSYNDLNYPIKKYKKNVFLEEEGKSLYAFIENKYGPPNAIKGADGVRFTIEGDENLYQFKKVEGTGRSEVIKIKSFAAERKLDYIVFNNEETVNLEDAEDLKKRCKIIKN